MSPLWSPSGPSHSPSLGSCMQSWFACGSHARTAWLGCRLHVALRRGPRHCRGAVMLPQSWTLRWLLSGCGVYRARCGCYRCRPCTGFVPAPARDGPRCRVLERGLGTAVGCKRFVQQGCLQSVLGPCVDGCCGRAPDLSVRCSRVAGGLATRRLVVAPSGSAEDSMACIVESTRVLSSRVGSVLAAAEH
jgi:hypothetical protein